VEHKRFRGIVGLGWACLESAVSGRTEHRPTSADYPDTIVRRISFSAGGGLGWKISALTTPREHPAPWKIVVVTGAPSWAEYWAPVLAALPVDREMVVVDRPGFGASEPFTCVPDIRLQAEALAPLLQAEPGQSILLVGQSYGAAIAALMAAAAPKKVAGVVLLSSFLGEAGPTARWLVKTGSRLLSLIPRDLRNAVMEVSGQRPQLTHMRDALKRLRVPVHVVHGDEDDFAPGANHFLNDGPVETLLGVLEACIPMPAPARQWSWQGVMRLARARGGSGERSLDKAPGLAAA